MLDRARAAAVLAVAVLGVAGVVAETKASPATAVDILPHRALYKVTLDKATHHSVRNAFLAEAKDKLWDVVASYPDQKPSDTAAVCDLVKNPNDNKQYVISL